MKHLLLHHTRHQHTTSQNKYWINEFPDNRMPLSTNLKSYSLCQWHPAQINSKRTTTAHHCWLLCLGLSIVLHGPVKAHLVPVSSSAFCEPVPVDTMIRSIETRLSVQRSTCWLVFKTHPHICNSQWSRNMLQLGTIERLWIKTFLNLLGSLTVNDFPRVSAHANKHLVTYLTCCDKLENAILASFVGGVHHTIPPAVCLGFPAILWCIMTSDLAS